VIDESVIDTSSKTEIPGALQLPASDAVPRQDILTAAKGGGIAFAGMLFAYISRFVFGIVVARMIGAEQWGLYALGLTVATIVSTMALLGLQTGVVRYVPIAVRQRDEAGLWGIIQVSIALPALLGLIFATIVFLLAEPLAKQAFNEPDLEPVLRLISLSIPLAALITIVSSITRGFKQMQYEVYANNVALSLVKLSLTVGLLIAGLGTMGVVAAHVTASAVTLVLLIYFTHTLFPLNRPLHTARRSSGELLRFSLPVYLARLINTLGGSFETLVLGFLGMTVGVGVYAAALRLSTVGNLFYLSIVAISSPIISDLHSRGESVQLERFYQTTAKWSVMFNLPVLLTFVLFAEPLLSIFGADFTAGATGLIILAFGSLANAGVGPCGTMINMTGHSKLSFVNSVFFLVTTLGFDLLFIPRWGVTGAALASSLSIALVNILRMLEVFFLFRILPYNWSSLKPVTAGLVATGVTCLINQRLTLNSLMLQVAAGMSILWGIYVLMVILLKFSEEDRLVLNRLRVRLNFKKPIRQYFAR